MNVLENASYILLWSSVVCLAVLICACMLRAILGPRFTDRIVVVNAICSKSIIVIAILSFLLGDSSYLDIAIVYAMISFLAVAVLSKCYLLPNHLNPLYPDKKTSASREQEAAEQ